MTIKLQELSKSNKLSGNGQFLKPDFAKTPTGTSFYFGTRIER